MEVDEELPELVPDYSCEVCGKQSDKKCSGCKSVYYCSVEHQKQRMMFFSSLLSDSRLANAQTGVQDLDDW
jgi:hypothetical protein